MSLTSPIVLNDGTTDHSFTHISRDGMNSVYVEQGVDSGLASCLNIKHTLDRQSEAKNRHLAQRSWNYTDPVTGKVESNQVHLIILRSKKESDATILEKVEELKSFLTPANVAALLLGDN